LLIFDTATDKTKLAPFFMAPGVGERSSNSKVIIWTHRHTHTQAIALPGPLKWLASM